MIINEMDVYSPEEARRYLKISSTTMIRMIKKGLIRTAKIGKQYRILVKELLRIVSPKIEDEVGKLYNKGRNWIHDNPPPKEKTTQV